MNPKDQDYVVDKFERFIEREDFGPYSFNKIFMSLCIYLDKTVGECWSWLDENDESTWKSVITLGKLMK
jgi:hypothetical protein